MARRSNTGADLHVQIQPAPSGRSERDGPGERDRTPRGHRNELARPRLRDGRVRPPGECSGGTAVRDRRARKRFACTQGYWWTFVDGVAYPSGEALFLATAWIPFGGDNGEDFAFRTYVDPSVPSVNIADRTPVAGGRIVPVTVLARAGPGNRRSSWTSASSRVGVRIGDPPRTGLTPCDGSPHRLSVRVTPESGSFRPGASGGRRLPRGVRPVEGDLDSRMRRRSSSWRSPPCRVRNVNQGTWFVTGDGSALEMRSRSRSRRAAERLRDLLRELPYRP